jgi:hypothetical protein
MAGFRGVGKMPHYVCFGRPDANDLSRNCVAARRKKIAAITPGRRVQAGLLRMWRHRKKER